jgi:D-amino-acid dehydrogenase
MLGLSLAAASGKLVEEIVGSKKTSMDITAFNVERYG